MKEIKLKDREEWHGVYRNVPFEIVKWKADYVKEKPEYDHGYTWNYYIIVKPRRNKLSKGFREGEKRIDYWKMYPDVEMHGGITYLEEITSSSLHKSHRIGCDYAHLGDLEYGMSDKLRERTVEEIMRDVKETIDNLPKDLFFN